MSTTLKKTQGEVISSLRQKNLDLSAKFKEATAILDSYKRGELGAESKIKSLNDLHSQKVKKQKQCQNLLGESSFKINPDFKKRPAKGKIGTKRSH
jgi:hypothetical protein